MSNSLWALADQAASSLGNFITNLLLARSLGRENYGTFGLILELIFFLNAIQSALITYPLLVRGANADRQQLRRYSSASLLLTCLLAIPVIAIALVTGALSGQLLIASCACLALLAWQLQETLRRAMLSQLRHAQAICGDAISYLGQALGILALIAMDRLTLQRVFAVIALTSTAGAMIQLVQVGLGPITRRELLQHAREFFGYGRYLAANNCSILFTSLAWSWVLTWFHGRGTVAEMYALFVLLKLTSPLINGIVSVLVPATAKVYDTQGPRAAQRLAARYGWLGAAILIPYLLTLSSFPKTIIELVYGPNSVYADDANVLRLYVAMQALHYAVSMLSAYFNATHQSRVSLIASMVNSGVSLLAGLPLAIFGGLFAAAAGAVLCVAAQLAVLLHFLANQRVSPGPAVLQPSIDDAAIDQEIIEEMRLASAISITAAQRVRLGLAA
ncbi:MAG TPA: oligosaccharide flippase family protein [Tepidisphaeraceae bacterium]|nr:oligosaccharide flippase family protein [Tepidisphaeraceae bacterium]